MWIRSRRGGPHGPAQGGRADARAERGSTLLAASACLLVVAGIAVAVARVAHDDIVDVESRPAPRTAQAVVDDALNQAWATVTHDGMDALRARLARERHTPGTARSAVEVEDSAPSPSSTHKSVNIVSIAACAKDGEVVATALVVRGARLPAVPRLGVFADRSIEIGRNARVSSYDSRLGARSHQNGARGHIRSNGTISLAHGAVVQGDATPGPMRNVTLGGNAHVSGRTAASERGFTIAAKDPHAAPHAVDKRVGVDERRSLAPGSHAWQVFTVEAGGELKITGPATITVATLHLAPGATVRADTTKGPVRFRVRDNLAIDTNARLVSANGRTGEFEIRVEGRDAVVTLGVGADLGARLFAPQADIELGEGARLFGSVVGRRLRLAERAEIHVDEALLDSPSAPGPVIWKIVERRDLSPTEARTLAPAAYAAACGSRD